MSDIVERLRRPVFDSEEWYSALGAAFKMRDAGHRDSCARDLMDSYVDEAATERTEAADEIERLRAEVARLTADNDWLRAYTGQSAKACVYCGLGADEQGKCERGFPGCARADDQMLCREVGVAMERDALQAEVARLTAKLETKRCTMPTDRSAIIDGLRHLPVAPVSFRRMAADMLENDAARVEAAEKDAARLDALEAAATLHHTPSILYYVDGYGVEVEHDDGSWTVVVQEKHDC